MSKNVYEYDMKEEETGMNKAFRIGHFAHFRRLRD